MDTETISSISTTRKTGEGVPKKYLVLTIAEHEALEKVLGPYGRKALGTAVVKAIAAGIPFKGSNGIIFKVVRETLKA